MINNNRNSLWIFLFSICYMCILMYCVSHENFLLLSIPLFLAVIYLSIFNFKYLFFLVVFLTPLSMSLIDLGADIANTEMAFPTEPLLFGLMLLTIFKIAYNFSIFRPLFKHYITAIIILYIIWMTITSLTSSMPLVSFKVLLSRMWYIIPVFFTGHLIFKNRQNISYFFLAYSVPLAGVIVYTSLRHSMYFFDKQSAHYMMSPFFNDHTSYGALIAFFIPLLFYEFLNKKSTSVIKYFLLAILFIFIVGFILSFSRAAWISLFLSALIMFIIKLKIHIRWLVFSGFSILVVLLLFQQPILNRLSENRQDSSDNLIEHVTSLSNISTDASNMERINRWKCAVSMFLERPFFGWGPGTYQFQYAPFQLSSDRTIISSNSGDAGNAHSEYLGPLAESGFMGLVTFLLLVIVVVFKAINMYYKSDDQQTKGLLLAIITALISYFIHGIFNNFLDTDKASVPIWGVIAILVSIDLYKSKNKFIP